MSNSSNEYRLAVRDSFPVVIGYFTVSFVFGISCVNYGLPIWFPALMSFLVYAGAAQFSFLTLFTAGASITTIVIATFFINLRHGLMSVYMSDVFDKRKLGKKFRWLYGHGLTDESFAFHSVISADNKLSHRYFLSFNAACHASWIIGSLTGALLITIAQDITAIKLEYALTAMMVYVLVLLANDRTKIITAIVTIISMILLSLIHESQANIFLSTFVGCGVGVWLKKKR